MVVVARSSQTTALRRKLLDFSIHRPAKFFGRNPPQPNSSENPDRTDKEGRVEANDWPP
jgi:hypothetical protein